MRQGQQNRRGRGRNRKPHHNPLTRSFESNGPDVKIRGTPSHIAEKYMSLARDAQASGDPVLAENYLQHAEHYNRIIMAFREQSLHQQAGDAVNGVSGRPRGESGEGDEFADEDGSEDGEGFALPTRALDPQPRGEGQGRFDERPQRHGEDRHHHRDRGYRDQGRPTRERYVDRRGSYQAERQPQPGMQPSEQPQQSAEQPVVVEPVQQERPAPPRRRERFVGAGQEQPEFLRRSVRRPRREANNGHVGEGDVASLKDETETD